jgi:hypothetical protein
MLDLTNPRALGLLVAALSLVGCDGCSDETETPAGGGGNPPTTTGGTGGLGGGGAGGDGGMAGEGGVGGVLMCDPGEGTTLALTSVDFGNGPGGEWKSVGLNLDGLVSDDMSTDVCLPSSGGDPQTAYPDGNDGIDNSFGKNLLPLLQALSPNWQAGVDTSLAEGRFNAMVKMYCLPESGNAAIVSKVFNGTDLGAAPQFDGTDEWPVAPEILGNPVDPESSTLVFENSTVVGSTFDSGSGETFVLTVPISFNNQTALLKLTLYGATIRMDLSDDRKSATNGVIGGVLNTEEVIDQVKKIAFIEDLCEEATYEQILTAIRRASDILSDGTQDPTMTCDGISFGLRFEMSEVQLGAVGPFAPVGMSCP